MLSVQKAKIGRGNTERMASLFRDGSEIRGTARLLTNFLWSIGQKWPPDSDWNDEQSCFDRRWDAVNERSGCLIFGGGGKGKKEKKSSIEVDQIWGGKSLGSNSMHRCCGDW